MNRISNPDPNPESGSPHHSEPLASVSRLDKQAIATALGARASAFSIELHESCTSSNSLLLEGAAQGAAHRSVLVCERQSAGRGRRGRSWVTLPGGSLAFSLLWRVPPDAPTPTGLSLAVGVGVARALEHFQAANIALKWPNDVLHEGRKLAGILIELTSTGDGALAAVIGIGLNLRLPVDFTVQGPFEATDLASAVSVLPSRERLLARVLLDSDDVLLAFAAGGFAAVREEWVARNAYRNAPIRLTFEHGAPLEGRFAGVDDDGALLLLTDNGVQRVVSGDVSLRPA